MARRGAKPFKPSCRPKGSWGLDAHPSGAPATAVARLRPRTVQQHIVQQAAGSSETHPAREHLTEQTAAAAAGNTVKMGTATATTSTVSLYGNASPTTAVRGLRASLAATPVKRGNATVAGAPTGTSALSENGVLSRVVLGSKEGPAAADIVAKGIAAIAEKKVLSAPADVVPKRRIDALSVKESVATPIGAERVAASAYEEISARSKVDKTTLTGTGKQQAAASVGRADNATSTGTETLQAAASIRTVSVGSTVSANSAEAAVQATAAASTVADAQGADATLKRLGLGLRPVSGACSTSAGGIRNNRKISEHFSVGRRTGHLDVFVRRDRPGIAASKVTTANTAVCVGVTGGRTAETPVDASTKSAADVTFISSAAPNRLAVTKNFLKTDLFRVVAIPNAADSNSDVLTSLRIPDDSVTRLTERRRASKAEGDAETIKPINEVSVKIKPEAGSNVPTMDFPSTMGTVELSSTRESATGRTGMCEVGAAIPKSSVATEIEGKRCQIASASQGVAETPRTPALCTGTAATELEQTSSETTTADIPPAQRRDVSENELLAQKSEYNTAPIAKEDTARTTVDTTTAPRPKIAAGAAGYSGRAVVGRMPPYLKGTEKLGLRDMWKEEKGSSLRTEGGATRSSELIVACGIERNCLPEEGVDMLVQRKGSIAGEREEDERGISGQTGATMLGTSCEVENAANGSSSSSRGCSSDSSSTGMIDNSNTGKDTFDKRRNNSDTVSTSICGNNSIGAFSLFGTETEIKIKAGNGTGYCRVPPVRHEEGNWLPKRRTYSAQQPEQEAGRKGNHQRSKNRDPVRLRESLQSHSTNELAGMHYLSRGEQSTRLQLYRMQGSYEERQQQQQEHHYVQNVQGHGHSDASEAGKSCLHQPKQGVKEYKRPLNQQSQAREDELQMQPVPQAHCDKYVLGNRVEESCAQEVNEKACKGQVNFKEETVATTQWRKEEITQKVTEPIATAPGPTAERVAAATAVALPAARRASSATAIRTITTTRAISPSPFLQKAPPGTISGKNVARSRVARQRATNKAAFKALTGTEVETRQDIKAVGVLETAAAVRENNQTGPQSANETTSAAISQPRRQGGLAEDRISLSQKRRKQVDRPLEDRQIGGVEVFVTVGWLSAFLPSSAGATEVAAPTVSRRAIATARVHPEVAEYVGVSLAYKSAAKNEGQIFRMWRVEDENAVGPLSPVLPLDNPYEVEIYEMSFQQQMLALIQQHLDLSWSQQEREGDGQQKEDRDGKAGQQRDLPPHKQVEVAGQKAAKRQRQKHKLSCLWGEPGSPEVLQTNSEQIKAEAQLQQLWQEPKKDPQSKPQELRLYQRGYEDEVQLQEEQLEGYGRGELLCQNWEKTLSALINALPHLLQLLWQHRQHLKKREKGRKMQQQEDTQEFLLHADYHLEQQVGCQDSSLLHLTLEHQQETQQQCEKTAQKQKQQQQPYEPSDWWEGQSLLDTRQKQEHTAHRFVIQAEEQKQLDKPFHKPTEADVATKQLGKDNTRISDGILFDYIRAEVKKRVSEILRQQQTRLDIQPLVEDAAAVSKYLEHLRAQQTVLQCQISLLQEQISHIAQQQATLEEQRYQLTFYRKCLKLRQGQVLQLSEIPSQHHKLPEKRTVMMEEHQQQLTWQTVLPEQKQVEQTIEQMRRDPRERPHEGKDSETCRDQELRGCFTFPQEAGNLRDMQQRAIRGQNDNTLSLDEQQQQLLLQLMQELSHRQEQQQYQQQSGDSSEIPRSQEEKCDCLAKAQQQQLQQTDEQFQIFMEQQQQQRKVDYPCMSGQEEEEDEECAQVGVLPQHQQHRADYLGSVSASLERILIKLTSSDSNLNAEAEARTDSGVDPSTSTQNLSTCNLSEMVIPATFPSAAASFATKSAAAPLLSASSLLSVLPAAPAAGIPPQSSQIPCQYRADKQSKQRQAIRQQWRFSGETEHNEELLLNDHDCSVNNSSKGQQVASVGRLPEATSLAAPSGITPALSSMYGQPPEHLKSFPSSFSLRAFPSNTITHVAACRSGRAEAGYATPDQEAPVNLTSADSSSYLASACARAVADSHDATPTHLQAPGFLATIRAPQSRALLPPDREATAPVTALALRGSAAAADVLTSGPSQEGGEQRQNGGGGGGRSAREAGTTLEEKNAVCLRLEVLTAAAAAFDDRAATGCKDNEANQSDTPEATARVAVLLEAWDWSGVKAANEEGGIAIEEDADRAVVTKYAPITIDRLREDGHSEKQRGQDAWEERSQHLTKQQREQQQQQQQERTQMLLAENEFPMFETQFYYMSKAPVVVNRCDGDILGTTTNPAAPLTDFDAVIGGKQAARGKASFPLVELQRETVVGMSTATISKAATSAANSYIAKQQEPAAAEETAAAAGICSVIDAEAAAILEEVEGSEKKSVDALKTAFSWSPLYRCLPPYDGPATDLKRLHSSDWKQQKLQPGMENHMQQQYGDDNNPQQRQHGAEDKPTQEPAAYRTELGHQEELEKRLRTEQCWFSVAQPLTPASLNPSAATPFSAAPLAPRPADYSTRPLSLSDLVDSSIALMLPGEDAPTTTPLISYGFPYDEEKRHEQLVSQSDKPVPSAAAAAPLHLYEEGRTLTRAVAPLCTETAVERSQVAAARIVHPKATGNGGGGETNNGSYSGRETAMLFAFGEENGQEGKAAEDTERRSSWSPSVTDQERLSSRVYSVMPMLYSGRHESYESRSVRGSLFTPEVTGRGIDASSSEAVAAFPPRGTAAQALPLPRSTLTPETELNLPIAPPITSSRLALPLHAVVPEVRLPLAEALLSPRKAAGLESSITARILPVEARPLLPIGSPLPATPYPADVTCLLQGRSAGSPEATASSATEHSCVLTPPAFPNNRQYYKGASCIWKAASQPQLQSKQICHERERQHWQHEGEVVQWEQKAEDESMRQQQEQDRTQRHPLQQAERQYQPSRDATSISSELLLPPKDANAPKPLVRHTASADSLSAAQHAYEEDSSLQQQQRQEIQQQRVPRLPSVPVLGTPAATEAGNHRAPIEEDFYLPTAHARQSEPIPVVSASANRSRSAAPAFTPPAPVVSPLVYTTDKASPPAAFPAPCLSAVDNRDSHTATTLGVCLHDRRGCTTTITAAALATTYGVLEQCHQDNNVPVVAAAPPRALLHTEDAPAPPPPQHPRDRSASRGQELQPVPTVCTNDWACLGLHAAVEDCSELLPTVTTANLRAPLQVGTLAADTMMRKDHTGLFPCSSGPQVASAAEAEKAKPASVFEVDQHYGQFGYSCPAEQECTQQHQSDMQQQKEKLELLQHQLQQVAAQQQGVMATMQKQQGVQQEQKLGLPQLQQIQLQQQKPQTCSLALEEPKTEETKSCGLLSFHRSPSLILQQYRQWQSEKHPFADEDEHQQPLVLCKENRLNRLSCAAAQQQEQHDEKQPQQRHLGRCESEQQQENARSASKGNSEGSHQYFPTASQQTVLTLPSGGLMQPESLSRPMQMADCLCNQQTAQQRHTDKVNTEAVLGIQLLQEAAAPVDVNRSENNTDASFFRSGAEPVAAAAAVSRRTSFAAADVVIESVTGKRSQHAAGGGPYSTWDGVSHHRPAKQWYSSSSTSKNRNSSSNAIAVCIGRVEEGPRTRSPMACMVGAESVKPERHTAAVGMKQRKASVVKVSGITPSEPRVQPGIRQRSGPHSDEGNPFSLSSPLSKAENTRGVTSVAGGTRATVESANCRGTAENWNGEKSYCLNSQDNESKEKASESGCNSVQARRGISALTEATAGQPGSFSRRAVYMQQQRLMRTRGQRFPCHSFNSRHIMHRQAGMAWREELPTAAAPPPPPPPLLCERETGGTSAISVGKGEPNIRPVEPGVFTGTAGSAGFAAGERTAAAFSTTTGAVAVHRTPGTAHPVMPPPRATTAGLGMNWSDRRSSSASPSAGRQKRPLQQQQPGEVVRGGGRHLPPYPATTGCRGARQFFAQPQQNQHPQHYPNLGFGGVREYWGAEGKRQSNSSSHVASVTAAPEYYCYSRFPRKGCATPGKQEEVSAAADVSFSLAAPAAKSTSHPQVLHYNSLKYGATPTVAATSSPCAVASSVSKGRAGEALIETRTQETTTVDLVEAAQKTGETEKRTEASAAAHAAAELCPGSQSGEHACAAGDNVNRTVAGSTTESSFLMGSKRNEGGKLGSSSNELTTGGLEAAIGDGKTAVEFTEQQDDTETTAVAPGVEGTVHYTHFSAEQKGSPQQAKGGGEDAAAETATQNDATAATEEAASTDAVRAATEVEEGSKRVEDERRKEEKGLTTVMLRNIPNKYNRHQVMKEIDVHFKGTYDFFYLPIDFVHGCNVGYCFINFLNVATAEAFRQEFEGKRLSLFKSRKICSVTYGRVQGLKAILEHYFHSAVVQVQYASWRPVVLKDCVELPWSELHKFFPELFENRFPSSSSSSISPSEKRDSSAGATTALKRGHRSSSLSSASSSSSFSCANNVSENLPTATSNVTEEGGTHAPNTVGKGIAVVGGAALTATGAATTTNEQALSQAHGRKYSGTDNGGVIADGVPAEGVGAAASLQPRAERQGRETEYGNNAQLGAASVGAALQEDSLGFGGHPELDIAARSAGGGQLMFQNEEEQGNSNVQRPSKDSKLALSAGDGLHDACAGTMTSNSKTNAEGTPGSLAAQYSGPPAMDAERSKTIEAKMEKGGGTEADMGSTGGSLLLSRSLSIGRRRGRKLGVTIEARRRELRNLASKHVYATNRFASYRESFAAAAASAARQRIPYAYSHGMKLRLYTKSSGNGGARATDSVGATAAPNTRPTGTTGAEMTPLPAPAPTGYPRTAARILNVAHCRGYIQGGRSVGFTEQSTQGTAAAAGATTAAEGGARVVGGERRAASAAARDRITSVRAALGVPAPPPRPFSIRTSVEAPGGSGAVAGGRLRRPVAAVAAGNSRSYLRRTAPPNTAIGIHQHPQHYPRRVLTSSGAFPFNSKSLYNSQQRPSSFALPNNRCLRLPGPPSLHYQLSSNIPERRDRKTEEHEQIQIQLQANSQRMQP